MRSCLTTLVTLSRIPINATVRAPSRPFARLQSFLRIIMFWKLMLPHPPLLIHFQLPSRGLNAKYIKLEISKVLKAYHSGFYAATWALMPSLKCRRGFLGVDAAADQLLSAAYGRDQNFVGTRIHCLPVSSRVVRTDAKRTISFSLLRSWR